MSAYLRGRPRGRLLGAMAGTGTIINEDFGGISLGLIFGSY
jgi:hypothetical protein